MKDFFVVCSLLASTVYGHMQMSNPYPIRSPLNPNGGDNKDYSYTSPLSSSGSDYPCKGYADDAFVSVADYTPGQSYDMELAGSATHGGGSCQLALSYDKGKSFTVIESLEGGCPIAKKYQFTIPSDAPTGETLLAWTWFNKIGNREMYMNCAQVIIKGATSKRSHPRDIPNKVVARDTTAFSSRPPIFLANINAEGQCTTTSNEEVHFPLPGPDLVGSVSGTGYTCKESAAFLGDGSSSSSGSASTSSAAPAASSSASAAGSASPAASSAAPSASPSASPSRAASSSATATPSSSVAPKTVGGGSCTDGEIVCGGDGNSFSICNHGSLTSMGRVAAGTVCKDGGIQKRGIAL